MNNQKYINRMDQPGRHTHGYQVRIRYRDPRGVNRYFSDSVYGGKRKALRAAKRFRDEACLKLFGQAFDRIRQSDEILAK